ncbi:MAG: dehydrogenase, partial [Rhodobacteraceae bacterium]
LSLRVEKGYGSWGREYSPEYWPHEVGLDHLIKLDKPFFLGRKIYNELKKKPPREKLVMLEVFTDLDADPVGGEPIFLEDGTPVGQVKSGAFSYTCKKSLALSMIRSDYASVKEIFDVAVIGRKTRAVILDKPPFDPKGNRLRS